MIVEGIIEFVTTRTTPKATPTIEMATTYCHTNWYSAACTAPKSTAVNSTPATMPRVRERSGCRKPLKNSSSNSGATVTAIVPTNASISGDCAMLSNGVATFGVCNNTAIPFTTNASGAAATTATAIAACVVGRQPSEANTGFP